MKHDLTHHLREWEYDPTNISARWVEGENGIRKVQLRLDLGIFQMEADGRPDGSRPRGYPSLLDYYQTLEKTSAPSSSGLVLGEAECTELQQEAVQYYYRYLCFYALEDLERVARDTAHNLAIFELVARHAEDDDLSWQFLQFYPEVKTMHTRAVAEREAGSGEYDRAVRAIRQGLSDVRAFWKQHGETEDDDLLFEEEEALRELMQEIQDRRPVSRSDVLRAALQRAVSSENFEKAAQLRDEIQAMEGVKGPAAS